MFPIKNDKYNIIKTSCEELASFIKRIAKDPNVIAALKAIPNEEAFAKQESMDISGILNMMAFQDIIQCLTAIFEVPKIGESGTCGIFCFINELLGGENIYETYQRLCLKLLPDVSSKLQDLVNSAQNWGVNATTEQFKVAILLSKVDDDMLNEYWHLMYNFAYSNIYGEEGHSQYQFFYLNNIISNAKENLEGVNVSYGKPSYIPEEIEFSKETDLYDKFLSGVKQLAKNGGSIKEGLINYRLSSDGNIEAYVNKEEVAFAIVNRMRSSKNKTTSYVARNYNIRSSQLKLSWFMVNECNAVRPGDCAVAIRGFIPEDKRISTFIHDFTIKSSFYGYISCPELSIENSIKNQSQLYIEEDTRLFILTPTYQGFLSDIDIFKNRGSVGSDEYKVRFVSNAYSDTFFYDINVMDNQPAKPISLMWYVKTGDEVRENQNVCKITTPFSSYFIKAKSNGIIGIDKEDAVPEDNSGYDYGISDFDDLYTLYNTKASFFKYRFNSSIDFEENDSDNEKKLKWDPMAGRYLDDLSLEPFEAFEVDSNDNKKFYISLQLQNGMPIIIFASNSDDILLSTGDTVSILLKDSKSEDSKIISFNLQKRFYTNNNLYNIAYCSPLFQEDINDLLDYDFIEWRIEGIEGNCISHGYNSSNWTQNVISYRVFRNVVRTYSEFLISNDILIPARPKQKLITNKEDSKREQGCFITLIYNKTKHLYKMAITEKPYSNEDNILEILCSKNYGSFVICTAIVSALKKAFHGKEIDGEWFKLSENELNIIKDTLS